MQGSSASKLRLGWCAAVAIASVFGVLALLFHLREISEPRLLDFTNLWATGKLALHGHAADAYDPALLAAAQAQAVGRTDAVMPYPYPPAFLLITAPLALLPYHLAFAAWVLAGVTFFLWAARSMAPPCFAAAQPAMLINGMIGQTGFFTGGLLLLGARRLVERPWSAGLILGLLILKPQLALMLPLAVVAARAWPAIGGALVTIGSLFVAALLLFGLDTHLAFARMIGGFGKLMGGGELSWNEFASPYALAVSLGLGFSVAATAQLLCAGFAAALCWKSWHERWAQRVPIVCTASLLASPYLQSYDSLPLLAAIAWFGGRRPGTALALYLLCLLPVASQSDLVQWPNTIPLASLLALALLWRERRQDIGQITPTFLPAASNMPRISPTCSSL